MGWATSLDEPAPPPSLPFPASFRYHLEVHLHEGLNQESLWEEKKETHGLIITHWREQQGDYMYLGTTAFPIGNI